MDEKILQKIGGMLNDPPELPFDERAWEGMQKKLYPGASYKNWMLAAAACLLLLLWLIPAGISYVAFQRLDDANESINELKTLIAESKNTKTTTSLTPEYQTTIVYDTIYKTVIIENVTYQNQQPSTNAPQSNTALFGYYPISSLQLRQAPFSPYAPFTAPFSIYGNNAHIPGAGNVPPESLVELGPPSSIDYLPINFLDNTSNPDLTISTVPYEPPVNKKGLRYYMYKMQPTGFALSGNIGQYLATYGTGRGINFTSGIEAEIGYGKNKNLGLVIGGEYMQWKFDKSREEDEEHEEEHDLAKQFPAVQPDSDDDILNEVYGDFKYVQIPIGFKYTFHNYKSLIPFIGLGVAARYPLQSNLTYEFLADFDEYKKDLNKVLEEKFEMKSAWASAGLRYVLNDHWNFSLDGRAILDFEKGEYDYEQLRLFSLRIGMQRVF